MSQERSAPSRYEVPPRREEAAAEFVAGLGRAVKSISLYTAAHPLAGEALRACFQSLLTLLSSSRDERVVLSCLDDRWFVDEARVSEPAHAREALKRMFQNHGLSRVTFTAGVHLFELAALCELGACDAANPGEEGVADFLAQKGAVHVLPEGAPLPLPVPPRASPSAPAPSAETPRSFGVLLKTLVESAVNDPEERGHIYKDALKLVKEALDRHVEGATRTIHEERMRLLGEQERTERVLETVADGKVIVDKNGKILMMNEAAEKIAGKRLAEVAGKRLTESGASENAMVAMSPDIELPRDGALSQDIRVIAQEEVERALKRSLALVQDDRGRVVGTYAVLPEVTKFKETLKMQEEFLSRVTHDLKAPLTAISCGLELIAERQEHKLPEEDNRALQVCLRNSRRLADMIAEILDFSKLQSGALSVKLAPTPLAPIIREAVEALRPWADSRHLTLAGECADLVASADPDRVVHILTNLISNGIKSTPSGGEVRLRVRPGEGVESGFAVVTVTDTGCGISKEFLDKIFEKFIQIDGTAARRDGIGLGLTIVRELVNLHGGRVWVESEPGRGATFAFTLPLAGPAVSEVPPLGQSSDPHTDRTPSRPSLPPWTQGFLSATCDNRTCES